jgi:hypothetical protein
MDWSQRERLCGFIRLQSSAHCKEARVGWVEAIAETHHNPRPPDDGFRVALPILQRQRRETEGECGLPVDR